MRYLVVIKMVEGSELFSFNTEKDRQGFINEIDNLDTVLDYAISEVKENNNGQS